MAKYVDVEKEFCEVCEIRERCKKGDDLWCDVPMMEEADVAPILRSRWVGKNVYGVWCEECENCGEPKPPMGRNKYCNCCGALMNKEE